MSCHLLLCNGCVLRLYFAFLLRYPVHRNPSLHLSVFFLCSMLFLRSGFWIYPFRLRVYVYLFVFRCSECNRCPNSKCWHVLPCFWQSQLLEFEALSHIYSVCVCVYIWLCAVDARWWGLRVSASVSKSVCCISVPPPSLIPAPFYLCLLAVLLDSRTFLLLLLSNSMKGAFITICLQVKGENRDKWGRCTAGKLETNI